MERSVHFAFGVLGNIFGMLLFLAPVITFKRIVKNRSTESFSGIPYTMTLLTCLLSTWYGLPFVSPNNILVSTINGCGFVLESIYIILFLIFAPKKEKAKIFGLLVLVIAVFTAIALVSVLVLHGNGRRHFSGVVNTLFSTLMYASPLTIITLVIKTKSVEFMPFFLSFFMFLCTTSWFIFGLLGNDPFIYIQSGIGCGLSVVQLTLYAIYYKNKGGNKSEIC